MWRNSPVGPVVMATVSYKRPAASPPRRWQHQSIETMHMVCKTVRTLIGEGSRATVAGGPGAAQNSSFASSSKMVSPGDGCRPREV